MSPFSAENVCERIARIRSEVTGPRGKAKFAKQLGISPSTYDYYESSRIPPASILLRIAEVGGVGIQWLLTGQAESGLVVDAGHPVLRRAAALLADAPNAAAPLAAFVDLLAQTQAFPQADQAGQSDQPPLADPALAATRGDSTEGDAGGSVSEGAAPAAASFDEAGAGWIPVLGRTAAGVPHFWAEGEQADVTELGDLIDHHAAQCNRYTSAAVISAPEGPGPAQIITVRDDQEETGQFICAESIKARHPDAFALQVDGNSMSPDIRHGDFVVLSPSVAAADGGAAVVQLAGQIGVTCKLYRRSGDDIHLVPLHDDLTLTTVCAAEVIWALRVLARVRPSDMPVMA
ncbi:MAG: XRE family transcriptional regulator [Planctomycetota bacterium]|jgi:SOS-response transcriptional repressor LexA